MSHLGFSLYLTQRYVCVSEARSRMRGPGSDSGEPRQLFDDTSSGKHNSGPGNMDKGGTEYAGHAILSDPMSNLAMAYGSSLASQGKQMMDKNVCALFLLICFSVQNKT